MDSKDSVQHKPRAFTETVIRIELLSENTSSVGTPADRIEFRADREAEKTIDPLTGIEVMEVIVSHCELPSRDGPHPLRFAVDNLVSE